ncbi:RtcB family protein [Bacillus sp. AFS029533]|uniref:RtcB family protein n=1 Tax=Bacillus sp. AFS029533 TaxID=2033494 RepID=UPI000BFB8819|nr:RtcB family protein [Bacillus sp. AFS029533]PGZ85556.1 RNA-splicing ligase RtcB [Bacillus sp. AFS029533]
MLEFNGKHNNGKILLDYVDTNVITRLKTILDTECFANSNIVVMPDCHIASGGVMVGFTMTLNDFIIPSIVGVDIGCGVSAYHLGRMKSIKSEKLDKFIRKQIPIGSNIHEEPVIEPEEIAEAIERLNLNYMYVMNSIATLGSGNHFIEIDKDENNHFWLVIHTGSRNFGFEIAKHHINVAKENMKQLFGESYKGFEYLSKQEDKDAYLRDLSIAQHFASLNRETIAKIIIEKYFKLDFDSIKKIESVHNYIDLQNNILRKGAISAREGEEIIIPFNMAYGCVVGKGKSSSDYNYSAPHGAGRIMSRTDAVHKVDLDVYQKAMKGVYTTSVNKHTVDESPMVYKKPKLILENITEQIEIDFFMKPVYNLKADK